MDITLPKFKFPSGCGGVFQAFAQNISSLQMTTGNRDFFRQVLQSVAYKKELLFTNLADAPGDITDGNGLTSSPYKGRAGCSVIVNKAETGLTIGGLEDESSSGYAGLKFACLGGPGSTQTIVNADPAVVLQLDAPYCPDPEGWCDGAQYRIIVPEEGYYIAFAYAHFSFPVNDPETIHGYPFDWRCVLHLHLRDASGTEQDSTDIYQSVYTSGAGGVTPSGNDATPYGWFFPAYRCQPNWYWDVTAESHDHDGNADGLFSNTTVDWAALAVVRIL